MTRICVDIMGSDTDPTILLEGVTAALKRDSNLEVLLVGSEDVLVDFVADHKAANRLSTHIATQVITMEEHPAEAVRSKKDASIVQAAACVRAGKADGLFSAGSTGAVLAAATFGIGRIKGIKRPALALAFPTIVHDRTVFMDMGANADVKPEVIVQFGLMGAAYAQSFLQKQNPKVGLLNNGSESTKGSELSQSYHAILAERLPGFVGNAEASDVLAGGYDVVITDGFSGNIATKAVEGTAKFIAARLKEAIGGSLRAKLGGLLLKPVLKSIVAELSGDEYGGAILLGLKAPVVKGHGASSARAVEQGILSVKELVEAGLPEKIEQALDAIQPTQSV